MDASGKPVRTLAGSQVPKTAGLHRIAWDLRASAPGMAGRGRGGQPPRGPQVLPGTYTVRLTANARSQDQKIEVSLDPELKVSAADLGRQWETESKLLSMIAATGDMLREATSHLPSPEWERFRTTLARPRDLSAAETGPRLSEQLQSLFNLVDGPNDAPTPAMITLLSELEDELQKASTEFHRLQP
jgi:hypothetical protein